MKLGINGIVIAFGALLIGGCATSPGELRSEPPYKHYVTKNGISEVSTCLVAKMEERNYSGVPVQASIKPIAGGQSVTAINNNELIDLVKTEAGTEVSFYSAIQKHANVWRSSSRTAETVEDIQSCL